ncbi:hypothetical protein V495_04899 [Pseudogymnoascus sp. VKM F-4514 (FW-929)]|nr:hypothetical protein V495_04899 [Pseudogymnoascus sp. VKM F-4514 (FW-929)]KFY54969.1 hypothetical protein V497_07320 [Pseudogymnoascus sp. VKM F-4516 (FW-969)]
MEEHRERKGSNVTPQLKLVGSPLLSRETSYKSEPMVVGYQQEQGNDANLDRVDSKILRDVPIFQRHEESTTIELFYDLFFVANLATFSNIHEINNTRKLTSYIGISINGLKTHSCRSIPHRDVSPMIYLGISFAFSHSIIAHRALYVIAVAEMVATIGIASQWKVDSLNKTLTAYPPVNALEVNENLSELVEKFKEQLTEYIKTLSENANASIDAASSAGSDIEAALLLSLQETFGFEAAEDKVEEADNNSLLKTVASLDTATLIFQFFFIATGMTIIIMGILDLINVRVYTKGSWLRFATHVSVGITYCLLCLLSLGEGDRAVSLSMTAWPLPMVAFIVFIVLAVHHPAEEQGTSR